MDLFHEMKNKHLTGTIRMINRIFQGEQIAESSFHDVFYQEAQIPREQDVAVSFIDKLTQEYGVFSTSEEKMMELIYDGEILIRLSLIEKIWLKQMLKESEVALFLGESTRGKLSKALHEVPDIPYHTWLLLKNVRCDGDEISTELIENMTCIIKAINEQKGIQCSNRSMRGKIVKGTSIPYKIEYSVIEKRFRASLEDIKGCRPVKANMNSLFNIKLIDIPQGRYRKRVDELISCRRSPHKLILLIDDTKNSAQRAAFLFSQYERVSQIIKEEEVDVLRLEITYYLFDEEELIRNILSFGPYAEVLEPEGIRNKIKEYLCKSI